jgi:hypothetical protein
MKKVLPTTLVLGLLLASSLSCKSFPVIDGIISPGEWDKAVAISLTHSWIMVRNNAVNLYVLIDVVSDTYEDTLISGSAWPDYFLLSFDVNIDEKITPNVDLNYVGWRANLRLDRQYYLGPDWTGILQGDTAGTLTGGFGSSLKSKTPHLIWELVIPLSEISAKPGGKVMIGLRTYSQTPYFTDDYPIGFSTSFSNLMEIILTR